MKRCASHPAFTLVELMIVLALLAIMAAIAAPQMGRANPTVKLESAARQIEQVYRMARHRAMSRHCTIWMSFQIGASGYRLNMPAADGSHDRDSAWRALDGVMIRAGGLRGTDRAVQAIQTDVHEVRITPAGATLPWVLELKAGSERMVIWSNGIDSRVRRAPGIELDEFDWEDTSVIGDRSTRQ